MERRPIQRQISIDIDYCEIPKDNSDSNFFDFLRDNGAAMTDASLPTYVEIKKLFLEGFKSLASEVRLVAIHKNMCHRAFTGKARFDSFQAFADALSKKHDNANIQLAWYGASKPEIVGILRNGFSILGKVAGDGEAYGRGLHLAEAHFSIDSVLSSEVDENGLRHVMFCRVILGKMETVLGGSRQFQPSQPDFDSGADNTKTPRRYVIWGCSMNSHIFATHIITFKFPCLPAMAIPLEYPNIRSWKAKIVMEVLKLYLNQPKLDILNHSIDSLRMNRITRNEFFETILRLCGRKLFRNVVNTIRIQQH